MEQVDRRTWLDLTQHQPQVHADGDSIEIGPDTNIQDGSVPHTDPGIPIRIGRGVSVGHNAVLHGCLLSDNVLVGMGAVLMNGVRVGEGSIIAGAVLLQGTHVPAGSLVAGVPGAVRRSVTDDDRRGIQHNAAAYLALAHNHRHAARE
ncbi:MAG: gamma carbonic anhydrase family protein [Actinomycetota bacterium]|nr:gamma carbonic anhydrase family protein [Actinomycetota bacterium]